jgi:hypothetical protein
MLNDTNVANAISDQTITIGIELPSRQGAAFKLRLQLLLMLALAAVLSASAAHATTYYVSKNGNNLNGLSWQHAWNELDQIQWTAVKSGDVILLDGGTTSMTYSTQLNYPSGTASVVITTGIGTDHSGQVIIDGTNSANDYAPAAVVSYGTSLTLEGRHQSGILVRNSMQGYGIQNLSNVFIDHVEVAITP